MNKPHQESRVRRVCAASSDSPDWNTVHFLYLYWSFLLRGSLHHLQDTSSFIFLWLYFIVGRMFQGRYTRKGIQKTYLQIILSSPPTSLGIVYYPVQSQTDNMKMELYTELFSLFFTWIFPYWEFCAFCPQWPQSVIGPLRLCFTAPTKS